jgi:hypothetical protein
MIERMCDVFLERNEERFVIFAADVIAVWHAGYDAAPQQVAVPPRELVNEVPIRELVAERLKDPVYAAAFMQAERDAAPQQERDTPPPPDWAMPESPLAAATRRYGQFADKVERDTQRDAERYRWLLAQYPGDLAGMLNCGRGELSEVIDAAMGKR